MNFIIACFAVYRISRDLVYEDGPFLLYAKLQAFAEKHQDHWIGQGLACPICLSFWLALLAACALSPASLPEFLLTWLGIAGGAVFLYKLTG